MTITNNIVSVYKKSIVALAALALCTSLYADDKAGWADKKDWNDKGCMDGKSCMDSKMPGWPKYKSITIDKKWTDADGKMSSTWIKRNFDASTKTLVEEYTMKDSDGKTSKKTLTSMVQADGSISQKEVMTWPNGKDTTIDRVITKSPNGACWVMSTWSGPDGKMQTKKEEVKNCRGWTKIWQ